MALTHERGSVGEDKARQLCISPSSPSDHSGRGGGACAA